MCILIQLSQKNFSQKSAVVKLKQTIRGLGAVRSSDQNQKFSGKMYDISLFGWGGTVMKDGISLQASDLSSNISTWTLGVVSRDFMGFQRSRTVAAASYWSATE